MILLKNLLALLLLSVIFVLCLPYMHQGAQHLITYHDMILAHLQQMITHPGQTWDVVRQLIALIVLPIVVGLVPALLFYIIRRQWMYSFIHIVWAVWLLQVGILAATNAAKVVAA